MSDREKIIDALSWFGSEWVEVFEAALAAARRQGAEEMRERAAVKADHWATFQMHARAGDEVAHAIRSLSVEDQCQP